jgi:low affinity Fe/Cu permease
MLELVIFVTLGLIIGWSLAKLFRGEDSKDRIIEELRESCSQKQRQLSKILDESISNRHQLLKKSNLLRMKSDELHKVQERFMLNSDSSSDRDMQSLKRLLDDKERLIESFDSEIRRIRESELDYIKISKDQFRQIEKSLKKYKKIADMVESIPKKSEHEREFEKKVKNSMSNLNNLNIANIFENRNRGIEQA